MKESNIGNTYKPFSMSFEAGYNKYNTYWRSLPLCNTNTAVIARMLRASIPTYSLRS